MACRWAAVLLLLLAAADGFEFVGHRLKGFDKCKDDFCFDYRLNVKNTGPFNVLLGEEADVLGHYGCVNLTPDQIQAEAEDAIEFFRDKYNLDFMAATQDQRLGIGPPATAAGANVNLTTFEVDADNSFRLVSASSRKGYDFLNVPIKDAGWVLLFLEDYPPTGGTYNYTVPAGAFSIFGSYIIDPCPKWGWFCYTFLKRRDRSSIFIRFQTRTYLQFQGPLPSTEQFLPFNLDLYSDMFGGPGLYRSILYLTSDPARVDLRGAMTFPPFRDD